MYTALPPPAVQRSPGGAAEKLIVSAARPGGACFLCLGGGTAVLPARSESEGMPRGSCGFRSFVPAARRLSHPSTHRPREGGPPWAATAANASQCGARVTRSVPAIHQTLLTPRPLATLPSVLTENKTCHARGGGYCRRDLHHAFLTPCPPCNLLFVLAETRHTMQWGGGTAGGTCWAIKRVPGGVRVEGILPDYVIWGSS